MEHQHRLPKGVVESPPWRPSKTTWMWDWAPCFRCPCLSRVCTQWHSEIPSNLNHSVILQVQAPLVHLSGEQLLFLAEVYSHASIPFHLSSLNSEGMPQEQHLCHSILLSRMLQLLHSNSLITASTKEAHNGTADNREDGRSTTIFRADYFIEGSYHVPNHVVHHAKHVYKATCLQKQTAQE